MFSGFVTTKRVVKKIGVHQRFDLVARRMIAPYLEDDTFPSAKQILHFEGMNGPDGLKVKTPGLGETNHLYDPAADTGDVPFHIQTHYCRLVESLQRTDQVQAAFEAAWLAHYVTDGLTPAHHFPELEDELAKHRPPTAEVQSWLKKNLQTSGETRGQRWRSHWAIWGKKGLLSTHINFEVGVALTILFFPLKVQLDDAKLARARHQGPVEFFKHEAREIAKLDLYRRFYETGWNGEIAAIVKNRVAPQVIEAVGIIWLMAYLEVSLKAALIPVAQPA